MEDLEEKYQQEQDKLENDELWPWLAEELRLTE